MANRVKSIVVGTAGHIDHGKSALVKALTGTDPDRLKEEKARGITIDLGFAHAPIGPFDMAFVDVPGHERFVKNMLAGVGGIDLVLLVIAADESVMPQTREHFAICRLLDISAGVIALSKADLVDAETLEIARLDARELLAGSTLADAPIVAVSSKTGGGLDDLRDALTAVAETVPARGVGGPPRLPIDRVFSMRGFGTVVTGTLTSGAIRDDEELAILPQNRRVKVRGIQVHGAARQEAEAGRRVAVNLGGVDVDQVGRGETLTRPGAYEVTRRFDAVIDLLPDARALRHGARVRFHQGTTELLGRVALAAADRLAAEQAAEQAAEHAAEHADHADRTRRGERTELRPGQRGYARIRLEGPAVLTRGDRFILRQYSPAITIGGGRVLDPVPARSPLRSAAGAARFDRLSRDAGEAALAFVEERRGAGLTIDAVARRAGLTAQRTSHVLTELSAAGAIVVAGDQVFSAAVARTFEERLLAAVTEHHRQNPLADGLPREEARERIFGLASPALFEHVVQRLTAAGAIAGRDRFTLPGRGVSLTPEESRARDALDRLFRDAGFAPPDVGGAAAATGVAPAVADRMTKLLLRQKMLVKLDTLLFHAETLERLKKEVAALKGQAGGAKVDVGAFKERYGISRKYAIPLLEWLDRERVTRRSGDARVIL
ncbi:MAG TPA: selenocysteine-specific translation elongation factor [Vicinamibacterales bacterium]|nr:selenocysteine-specific translation elongation factor [Vicinamibacterales bacterium]